MWPNNIKDLLRGNSFCIPCHYNSVQVGMCYLLSGHVFRFVSVNYVNSMTLSVDPDDGDCSSLPYSSVSGFSDSIKGCPSGELSFIVFWYYCRSRVCIFRKKVVRPDWYQYKFRGWVCIFPKNWSEQVGINTKWVVVSNFFEILQKASLEALGPSRKSVPPPWFP